MVTEAVLRCFAAGAAELLPGQVTCNDAYEYLTVLVVGVCDSPGQCNAWQRSLAQALSNFHRWTTFDSVARVCGKDTLRHGDSPCEYIGSLPFLDVAHSSAM